MDKPRRRGLMRAHEQEVETEKPAQTSAQAVEQAGCVCRCGPFCFHLSSVGQRPEFRIRFGRHVENCRKRRFAPSRLALTADLFVFRKRNRQQK